MRSTFRWIAISVVLGVASGCATLVTEKADLKSSPNGIRIKPMAVFMYVGKLKTTFACHEVDEEAYDMRPVTVFSKLDLRIEYGDCGMTVFDVKQDTTLSIGLFEKVAAPILGSLVGSGVSKPADTAENFGLAPGIYRMGSDLRWHQMETVCLKGNPAACTAAP